MSDRYYDPSTDQFLSIDPDVAETGQPYAFIGDDPLNASDPPGLMILRPVGFTPSFSEIIADPDLIRDWTPNQLQQALENERGLRVGRLSQGSAKDQGLKYNELVEDGSEVTDKSIMYHPPDIGHHVGEYSEGYFKVSSGAGGAERIDAARPTGALQIPGDDTDGFGHVLPNGFDPSNNYDPLTEEPPVAQAPEPGFWDLLEQSFFDDGGGDDG